MGAAAPITIDFGAMFPFTDVPAYNLPVYASQRPLPADHARLGARLLVGFAATVISDGSVERTCKAQPAQMPAVEGEFVFRIGRDLFARAEPYTINEVIGAIDGLAAP